MYVCMFLIRNVKFPHIAIRYEGGHLRHLHYQPGLAVIAAAARTPWGKYQGQLSTVSAWQLGQLAVEAAVKQSAIPVEKIQQIFMNETPELERDNGRDFTFSSFLKKAKYKTMIVTDCDEPKMENFLKALESLKCQPQTAVVVGGLESATQNKSIKLKQREIAKTLTDLGNHIAENSARYLTFQKTAEFDAEIVPLKIQLQTNKRRIMKEVRQDEISEVNCRYGDGAAALVLTTFASACELKLSPLAVIKDFEYIRDSSNHLYRSRECVNKLFSKIKLDPLQIQHWEIEDYLPQLVSFLQNHFNLRSDTVNPHGGSLILSHSSAASLARIATHLTHSLKPLGHGCVICSSSQESLALVIQKLTLPTTSGCLPRVTLYTKDSCPLCDALVEELELHFSGEYELEKIFIDNKNNLRFLRLYRLDIPVVFLNNQFLCMHRLNHRLLRKRLDLLNK